MLKISDAANIAFHAMGNIACRETNVQVSGHELADKLHVSSNHLAKVMQRLAKVSLVISRRGPKGGFMLGKNSQDITLLDIYEAIEGPLIENTCLMGVPVCHEHKCLMEPIIKIPRLIKEHLSGTTLASVIIDKHQTFEANNNFYAANI